MKHLRNALAFLTALALISCDGTLVDGRAARPVLPPEQRRSESPSVSAPSRMAQGEVASGPSTSPARAAEPAPVETPQPAATGPKEEVRPAAEQVTSPALPKVHSEQLASQREVAPIVERQAEPQRAETPTPTEQAQSVQQVLVETTSVPEAVRPPPEGGPWGWLGGLLVAAVVGIAVYIGLQPKWRRLRWWWILKDGVRNLLKKVSEGAPPTRTLPSAGQAPPSDQSKGEGPAGSKVLEGPAAPISARGSRTDVTLPAIQIPPAEKVSDGSGD